jgi:hypothetical protein
MDTPLEQVFEIDGIAPELLGGKDAQAVANQMRDDRASMLGDTNCLQGLLDNPMVVEDFVPLTREQIYDR